MDKWQILMAVIAGWCAIGAAGWAFAILKFRRKRSGMRSLCGEDLAMLAVCVLLGPIVFLLIDYRD